ncbi:HAD family hydrolase [Candidatus Woesearchaeota archaeon]|nr:HAD family hydrolase [Candidatus Woesearchaeota archaeon]
MFKAVIFDFDGVIIDTFPDQYKWFNHICDVLDKKFSYKTIEEFREDYKEPVYPDMYSKLGFDWEKEKDIIWKEYNNHKANSKIDLCKGIEDVLKKLTEKKKKLAIASSNTHSAINKQLKDHNLESYFSIIVGKEDVTNGEEVLLKPHPKCLLVALNKLDVSPYDSVYIGDSPTDIIAAKRVREYRITSIPTIAVTYGFTTKEKLLKENPEHIVDSAEEILRLV